MPETIKNYKNVIVLITLFTFFVSELSLFCIDIDGGRVGC